MIEGQRADENFWSSGKQAPGLVQRRQPRIKLRWAAIGASGRRKVGGRAMLGKAQKSEQPIKSRPQPAGLSPGLPVDRVLHEKRR